MRCEDAHSNTGNSSFSTATSPNRVFARIHAICVLVDMSNMSSLKWFWVNARNAVKGRNKHISIKATRIEYTLKTCAQIVEFGLAESNITVKNQ